MSLQRERRVNAGNRLSKLLEEEEQDDDFYKSTYGGFNDEEDDNEFVFKYFRRLTMVYSQNIF